MNDAGIAWLFPATYLLHATEEYFFGETFQVWISRLGNVEFTATDFLWLNGLAMVVMVGASWLAARHARAAWLLAPLGTVVAINAMAHLVGSLATWSYSPGVVTGTLLWLPLGVSTLVRTRRRLSGGRFAFGAALGVVAHAIVSAAVLLA